MANDNKKSRADDIFDVLQEYGGDNSQSSSSAPETINDNANGINPAGKSGADDEYFDELIGILSKNNEPVAEEQPEETSCEIDCNEELPDSIFAHLSDDVCERAMPLGSENESHFTEEPTSEEEEEEEVPEENQKGKKKKKPAGPVKRILQKISFIPKTIIYIALVLVVSAYLSYSIITIGNDIFAFVTDEGEVTIHLEDGMNDKDVAKLLKDNGIIEYGWVYEFYMQYRSDGDSASEYIPGEHTIDLSDNYSQIIHKLTVNSKTREIVRITIPEGFTVNEIIDELVSKGIGTKEGYVDAINNYPYKWEFVKRLDEMGYSEDRIYRLEGYLYPDTYEFYTDTNEVYIINKMLSAFDQRFWSEFTHKNSEGVSYEDLMLKQYNMTFDDIVTLASIVQSEGKKLEDFYAISDVFHNRLSHPQTYPKLESDATIQYVLPERETDSSQINVSYDSPYNTYLHKGLTPGAISNPGLDSLFAAMFPSKARNQNGYEITAYFFVSNDAGKTYYAEGPGGHQNNVAKAKKDNEAIKNGTYTG